MGQESGPDLVGFSASGLTKLKSGVCWAVFLSGHSTREGFISKLPQVAGKMHFLMAIEFMTVCFFKVSNGKGKFSISSSL